jgi:hypothetical protein
VPPATDGPTTGTPAPPFQSPTFEVPPPIDGPTTGTPAPPFQSACLAMVDQAVGDFPRRLVLDLAFDEGVNPRDIARLELGFAGANDAMPVDATHQFATTWQAVLGYRPSDPDPLRITIATVETPDGVVHNILAAVSDAIGTIPGNFGPGDSVGDLCGGFGDPF